jgi:hypothetical protein
VSRAWLYRRASSGASLLRSETTLLATDMDLHAWMLLLTEVAEEVAVLSADTVILTTLLSE